MDADSYIIDRDLRAARELLRWTQSDLAERSGVGVATIRRFEMGSAISDDRRDVLRAAVESAGVVFFGWQVIQGREVARGLALLPGARPKGTRKARAYKRGAGAAEAGD